MPELPEVETIRRQLDKALRGRVVKKVDVLKEKSFLGKAENIQGKKIQEVKRASKVIEVVFENLNEVIIIHLKMTGQLIYVQGSKRIIGGHPSPDWINKLPSSHTRVIWTFDDDSKLFFNDMRVFGWMKLVDKISYENSLSKKAPDVIDDSFTFEYFNNLLKVTKKAIKLLLLDQDKIGGLGNIYVNDALYLAGVLPDRRSNTLTKDEAEKLYKAAIKVIELGIKYGGASASNYVHVNGLGGTYQDYFLVYKKDGDSCKKCGEKIRKMKMGGRGTFFCPNCQK